jgi:cytochrome c-type biogenesis protein CcmE
MFSLSSVNSPSTSKHLRFAVVIIVIVVSLAYLAYTGVQEGKSYYVTIKELRSMRDDVYAKRLRVGGNVQPGSIRQTGTHADFVLVEQDQLLRVSYKGTEPPPDTFKDNAQALVLGEFGKDGVFHAREIQAKCASKYAPQQGAQASMPASSSAAAGSKSY